MKVYSMGWRVIIGPSKFACLVNANTREKERLDVAFIFLILYSGVVMTSPSADAGKGGHDRSKARFPVRTVREDEECTRIVESESPRLALGTQQCA